jgi:hypothetical protein
MRMATTEEIQKAWARREPIEFGDPTLARVEFPLQATYFPLGFPATVHTNSAEVLTCAAESWGNFIQLFDTAPIQLEIGVTGDGSTGCPPAPLCHIRQHICSSIADANTFAISDLAAGFSTIWVTQASLDSRSYFRYFFLESTAMAHIANCHTSPVHAACVELDGVGLLLCGDSGAGKSTLSYACAQAGWTYITDDGSFLVHGRRDRLVVGNCSQVRFRPASERLFPELRGAEVTRRAEIGKPSVELSTLSNRALTTRATSHVRHVVFLNRNSGRTELSSFPVEVAKLSILQNASSLPAVRNTQSRMIDQLLETGVFELHYSDLEWAVERLALLVHEGR